MKWNHDYSNVVANPPVPWGRVESKGQNSTFSEHGHVAYHIKWNHECSNTQAHIMSIHTPSVGSFVKTFFESSHIAYQIRKE